MTVATSLPTVAILRAGERDGGGGILRITTPSGATIHAVGVPQDWPSSTGPTWIYVVDGGGDGLTLIDAGSLLAVDALEDAFRELGMQMKSVRRIVVTHSHLDHDGGAAALAAATGGEVWAHAMFDHLRPHSYREIHGRINPIMEEAFKDVEAERGNGHGDRRGRRFDHREKYDDLRKKLVIGRSLQDGDEAAGLTFLHTPGHTPDELTIAYDGVLFTGDHVLPEITPHPTTMAHPTDAVKRALPERYRDETQLYGLTTYLRSLKRVASYGNAATVMPAHRLLNKGKLNVMTARRAQAILVHHVQRINRILNVMGKEAMSVVAITKALFSYHDMDVGNRHSAVSETFAHLELLLEAGDAVEVSGNRLLWHGTEHFREAIHNL